MGVFYSYSKKASLQGRSPARWTLLALLVPMMIHGTYDTFAFLGEAGTMPLLVFVVILYIAAISTIRKMSREDYREGFYTTSPASGQATQTFREAPAGHKRSARRAQQQPVQPQQQPVQPQQQPQQPVQQQDKDNDIIEVDVE